MGSTLFEPGDRLTYVPFPLSGTLSLIAQPDDGVQVEAATIGNEGAAEFPTALGSQTVSQLVVGQVSGEMFAIPIETFTEHVQNIRGSGTWPRATSKPSWSRYGSVRHATQSIT